jgi:hypothetical protein
VTVEEVFQSLGVFCSAGTGTRVLLASEDEGEELVFQRLTLEDSVSKEFGDDAIKAFANGDNFTLVKYEAGYKPDDDELCYLAFDESADVKKIIESIIDCALNFNDVELFKEDEDIIDSLRFYVVVANGHSADGSPENALFMRTFTPKNELARSGWKAIIQRGDFYNKVKEKIFMFDQESDCLAWHGYVFIKNVTQFERIFQYFEALKATADQTIATISPRLPIANFDEFKKACLANPLMLSKIVQFSKKPYLATVTMDDIKQTIKDFGLPIDTKTEGDQEKLVFDPSPSKRWLILKLLGDDYLGSTMTKLKYASNSKIQM